MWNDGLEIDNEWMTHCLYRHLIMININGAYLWISMQIANNKNL